MSCQNNLKQIGLALLNYRDAYGAFPPASVVGSDGKSRHSWRVLLLPFLEQQALYARYRFDEPWDGPNNSKLHDAQMMCYRCASSNCPKKQTNYFAVVGPETIWDSSHDVTSSQITDGEANTIAVIEMKNCDTHWMAPDDVSLESLLSAPTGKGEKGLVRSFHPGGAQVVFADGHVQFLSSSIDAATLRGLLTKSGGERLSEVLP